MFDDPQKELKRLEELGYGTLPVCMAKTQYSFSDDPTKLGAPSNYRITVRKAKVSAGAGFVVVLTGEVMTMPGLPKVPAAESIDVDENGKIVGLFLFINLNRYSDFFGVPVFHALIKFLGQSASSVSDCRFSDFCDPVLPEPHPEESPAVPSAPSGDR